jgi:hypothetical protein
MEKEATIIGTREGFYIACIDEERAKVRCNEECPVCPYDCRILLDREERLETGRHVMADIKVPLFLHPQRFYLILVGIFIGVLIILLLIKSFLPYYRSSWPPILGGFFGAAIFYLLVKIHHEKTKDKKNLRKGKIIRAYSQDR